MAVEVTLHGEVELYFDNISDFTAHAALVMHPDPNEPDFLKACILAYSNQGCVVQFLP